MSVKIYLKDNISGTIHEYGTNPHDALILQEDGSLHYENLKCTTCRENKNLQSRWEPRKVGGFSEILQPSE